MAPNEVARRNTTDSSRGLSKICTWRLPIEALHRRLQVLVHRWQPQGSRLNQAPLLTMVPAT